MEIGAGTTEIRKLIIARELLGKGGYKHEFIYKKNGTVLEPQPEAPEAGAKK